MQFRRTLITLYAAFFLNPGSLFSAELVVIIDYFKAPQAPTAAPYQGFLSQFPAEISGLKEKVQGLLRSEPGVSLEVAPAQLAERLKDELGLDFLLNSHATSESQITILDEYFLEDLVARRFEITHPLIGSFEGRILLPREFRGKHPAILGLHGHGGNPRDFSQLNLSLELARRGFVFITLEFRAMRRLYESHLSRELVKRGFHLMGIRLFETLLAMEFLKSIKFVDVDRIGVLSHSGGSLVGNLLIRIFQGVRALVFDYTSSLERKWRELCCESMPSFREFEDQLQSTKSAPIPALKTPYGYVDSEDKILDFFEQHLGHPEEGVPVPSPPHGHIARRLNSTLIALGANSPAHSYPLLQDQNILKLQNLALWSRRFDLIDELSKELILPQSKVRSSLHIIVQAESNAGSRVKELRKLEKLIARFEDPAKTAQVHIQVIQELCSDSVSICQKTLNQLNPADTMILHRSLGKALVSMAHSSKLSSVLDFSRRIRPNDALLALVQIHEKTANPNELSKIRDSIQSLIKKGDGKIGALEKCFISKINEADQNLCSRTLGLPTPFQGLSPYQILQYTKLFLHRGEFQVLKEIPLDRISIVELSEHLLDETFYPDLGTGVRSEIQSYLFSQFQNLEKPELKIDLGMEVVRGLRARSKEGNQKWFRPLLLAALRLSEPTEKKEQVFEILQEASESLNPDDFKTLAQMLDKKQLSSVGVLLFQKALEEQTPVICSTILEISSVEWTNEIPRTLIEEYQQNLEDSHSRVQNFLHGLNTRSHANVPCEFDHDFRESDHAILSSELLKKSKTLFEAIENSKNSLVSLENLWNLAELLHSLNITHLDPQISKAFESLLTSKLEDEILLSILSRLLQISKYSEARFLSDRIMEKELKENAKLLLTIYTQLPGPKDLLTLLEAILKLDEEYKIQYLTIFLEQLNRDQYLDLYPRLEALFKELNQATPYPGSLLLKWVEKSNSLGFGRDTYSLLSQISLGIAKVSPAQKLEWISSLIHLWMDSGNHILAGEIFLDMLGWELEGEEREEQLEISQSIHEDFPEILPAQILEKALSSLNGNSSAENKD